LSITLSADALELLDELARSMRVSRSDVLEHLLRADSRCESTRIG
jgi:hypothetical protein